VLESLIDRIYEAAGSPRLWVDAIQWLCNYAESDRSSLIVLPQVGTARWVASTAPKCQSNSALAPPTLRNTGRHPRLHMLAHTKFIQDVDSAFICCGGSDMCSSNEHPWRAGTAIQVPNGDLAIVTAERRAERGPYGTGLLSRLDALRPHLVRACHLSAQYGYERARVATTTLDHIGLPAAILTASGRILITNECLQASHGRIASGQNTESLFRNFSNSKLLHEAISGVADGRSVACTLPVRAISDHRAFVAHVHRIAKPDDDVFDASAIQLILKKIGAPPAPDNDLLHVLFDLTPAEARLLRALAGGLRLQIYAENTGVQASTVRSQLRSIFVKTGTNRQSELLSIVASISTFAGSSASR
jgi:DNA-binding CsgD family transcriptional regulator